MINGRTEIYGVIGYPVRHTMSPLMQNSAFKALGINARYLPFEVLPENLKSAVEGLVAVGVKGFNVTIPHKQNIIKFLDKLDAPAKFLGAVNTVKIEGKKLIGFNTDGAGFIDSIKFDVKTSLKDKNIFIFGAGGASRAISFSLAGEKVKRIVFADIDRKKGKLLAEALSKKTGVEAIAVNSDKIAVRELILNSDILINASPSGMHKSDAELIDAEWLRKNLIVYDIIYNPSETKLLKAAKLRGLRAFNGINMLLRQGARSFEIWRGVRPPVAMMKKALINGLRNQ